MSKLTRFPDTVRGGQRVELMLSRAELLTAVARYLKGQGHPLPENLQLDDELHLKVGGGQIVHHLRKSGACFFGRIPPTRRTVSQDFAREMGKGPVPDAKPADDACKPLEPLREADVVEIVKRVLVDSRVVAGKPVFCDGGPVPDCHYSKHETDKGRVQVCDEALAALGCPEAAERVKASAEPLRAAQSEVGRLSLRVAADAVRLRDAKAAMLAEVRRRETTEERLEHLHGANQNLQARLEALTIRLVEEQSRWEESQDKLQDAREAISAHEEREHQLKGAVQRLQDRDTAQNDTLRDLDGRIVDLRMALAETGDRLKEAAEATSALQEREHQLERRAEAAETEVRQWQQRWQDALPTQRPPLPATLSPDPTQVARDYLLEEMALAICNLPGIGGLSSHSVIGAVGNLRKIASGR